MKLLRRSLILFLCIFIIWIAWGYLFTYKVYVLFNPKVDETEGGFTLKDIGIKSVDCFVVSNVDDKRKIISQSYLCKGSIRTNFFSVKQKIKTMNENELIKKTGFPSEFYDRYRDS